VLSAKSADALTQFELDSLNWYLKEQNEKKLWMMQQQQVDEDFQIRPKFYSRVEGLTERYGRTAEVTLSQLDIQEEFEVEPVAMSMLSVDDDLRRQAAQQLVQMSAQMPGIVDPHYAARFYAGTIRGIDPDKAVPPPSPAPPSPPPPKFAVNVTIKWPELPAEIQAQLLQGAGGQITPAILEELQHAGTLEAVKKTGEAADAAENIMSPAQG